MQSLRLQRRVKIVFSSQLRNQCRCSVDLWSTSWAAYKSPESRHSHWLDPFKAFLVLDLQSLGLLCWKYRYEEEAWD